MILLSIIIPFYNTFSKSENVRQRILNTLQQYHDIEFILINDGSTDDTLSKLNEFFFAYQSNPLLNIIDQNNKGPGGARNTGLQFAKGKYIWFVDSDDDFLIDPVHTELSASNNKIFDFIDFNHIENQQIKNSMQLTSGQYDISANPVNILYSNLGRIWSKVFKRNFLIENNIQYPEYCIYEDNFLIYTLPIYINYFIKSDTIGYIHDTQHESVTRTQDLSDKYYDRILTSYEGIMFLHQQNKLKNNTAIAFRFKEIFLYNTLFTTIRYFQYKDFNKIIYILSTYKYLARELNIHTNNIPNNTPKHNLTLSLKSTIFRRFIDLLLVFTIPSNQISYFVKINKRLWRGAFTIPHK